MSWRRAGLAIAIVLAPHMSCADEGGVSFWLPGFFGSLAAAPQQPGFAFATVYYHTSVSADGDVAFARQVTLGKFTRSVRGNINANLDAKADLVLGVPSYVFQDKLFGGQAAIAMLVPYGRSQGAVDATLQAAAGPLGFTRSGTLDQGVSGFGDLVPQFSLRWNEGAHNFMTYVTGNLTTGRYDPRRLANLGIGHNVIDGGGGYTFFNPSTGNEFSAVLGFTYNFENVSTNYQNGVDMHLDLGASKFLTKQFQIGLVGYLYDQVSCDGGIGDRVGCFESRVAGIGPQIGYLFPLGQYQGFFSVRGYKEFDAAHRPDGWNTWVTFAISPAPAKAPLGEAHEHAMSTGK
jgi:hypothetical protein